ncbi:Vegetative incompatibility protein HET-E-1 [Cytospora mali]|uniref:Vegetative incompatibility protein HET-E-1 n=1 Tax=Cytospora mali TaxID=578113 RepID=A0A194VSP0_CYTMA|nr:Vegetative incompatibility protein HET-E-1 [Valsa mali]
MVSSVKRSAADPSQLAPNIHVDANHHALFQGETTNTSTMRLMNTTTLVIQEFPSEEDLPEFAILSHTWGKTGEECSLQDMTRPEVVSEKPGYRKIKLCCDQALIDGLEWAWVDTCCIDKTSTAELSEAINSMYRWYRKSRICYAYLIDVKTQEDLAKSKWFTRGWTLQELLAPKDVRFYSGAWQRIGSKPGLKREISLVTGIDESVLASGHFDGICVAKRMSWAANRHTTRTEDKAYSLMGIFGVNMPLLYGEGTKAFLRLQEEILKTSDDHSLFVWGLPKQLVPIGSFDVSRKRPEARELHNIFADDPAEFVSKHHLQQVSSLQPDMPPIVSANGIHIRLPVWKRGAFTFAAVSCIIRGNYQFYIGLVLYQWSQTCFARLRDSVLIPAGTLNRMGLLIKAPAKSELASQPLPIFQISIAPITMGDVALQLIDVTVRSRATNAAYFSPRYRTLAYRGWETTEQPLPEYEDMAIDVKVQVANINIVEGGIFVYIGINAAANGSEHIPDRDWWDFPGLSRALATSTGPFYLTIVPEDGSDTYPATVATVSRGAQILSSALEYDQLFTYDITSARIFENGSTTLGNGPLSVGYVVLFNSPSGTDGSALEQVIVDGNVFLVKNGTAEDGIYAWSSSPTTTGLAVQVDYEGGGSSGANAALMLDVVVC